MKTGLVLEGGAMRGMFTCGVMDVMMEHGIRFDGAIGVSAGACFGCNYKSGQIGRAIRYNMRFCADPRYGGFRVLLKEGNIYSTEFCYNEVPTKHDPFDFEAYRKDPMEFYVVATDIETGKPVYHLFEGTEENRFDWIRASASMPCVSKIVEIDGRKLLDGGISDSVPVKYFESIGYGKNVVILTQPEGYVKKPNRLIPLMKLQYKNYPKMVETMARRHTDYNNMLAYIKRGEQEGRLLVIRPEAPLEVGRVEKDPKKLKAAYDQGRKVALARIDEIRSFVAGKEE